MFFLYIYINWFVSGVIRLLEVGSVVVCFGCS